MDKLSHIKQYVSNGWHVLPVGFNKAPTIPNGCRGASSDTDTVTNWWKENPKWNVGIATGPKSGFWVIDVDIKDNVDGWESLEKHFGDRWSFDPQTQLIAKTASEGFHFLFQWDKNIPARNYIGVLPGVDIRGDGGYIVAAPSVAMTKKGWKQYQWNDLQLPIPPAPDWALELLHLGSQPSYDKDSSSSQDTPDDLSVLVHAIRGVRQGGRDQSLFNMINLMKKYRIDQSVAEGFSLEAASRCDPPFDPDEVRKKVKRAYSINH